MGGIIKADWNCKHVTEAFLCKSYDYETFAEPDGHCEVFLFQSYDHKTLFGPFVALKLSHESNL